MRACRPRALTRRTVDVSIGVRNIQARCRPSRGLGSKPAAIIGGTRILGACFVAGIRRGCCRNGARAGPPPPPTNDCEEYDNLINLQKCHLEALAW